MDDARFLSRPTLNESVDFRVLDDLSSMAVDAESGEAHALNPVATAVLERCDGTMTAQEIVAEVSEIFDGPPEQVAKDVQGFLTDLAGRGLIAW